MHIPDGIIEPPQAAIYLLISIIAVIYSLRGIQKNLGDKHIPLLGLLGAGLLAAQMFNFPVPFGTSGHLVGTSLATALVGPYGAIVVIATVLLIQMTFADGGITAIGANLLNMGVIGAVVSYFVIVNAQKVIHRKDRRRSWAIAVGLAGFIATMASSVMVSIELILAGFEPVSLVFGWMIVIHIFIGIGEALITWAIIQYVVMVRADLIYLPSYNTTKVSSSV